MATVDLSQDGDSDEEVVLVDVREVLKPGDRINYFNKIMVHSSRAVTMSCVTQVKKGGLAKNENPLVLADCQGSMITGCDIVRRVATWVPETATAVGHYIEVTGKWRRLETFILFEGFPAAGHKVRTDGEVFMENVRRLERLRDQEIERLHHKHFVLNQPFESQDQGESSDEGM